MTPEFRSMLPSCKYTNCAKKCINAFGKLGSTRDGFHLFFPQVHGGPWWNNGLSRVHGLSGGVLQVVYLLVCLRICWQHVDTRNYILHDPDKVNLIFNFK